MLINRGDTCRCTPVSVPFPTNGHAPRNIMHWVFFKLPHCCTAPDYYELGPGTPARGVYTSFT